METKYCGKCRKELELSFFSKNKTFKDGLGYYCRKCMNKARAGYNKPYVPVDKQREDKNKPQ